VTSEEKLREHTLEVLAASAPETFWRGLQDRTRTLYRGEYAEVASDPRLNDSQRLNKLWQDRHFRMEWLLADEANKCGLPASARLIEKNGCAFTLVSAGGVTMTQKYVASQGDMPSAAKFRADLAAINDFHRQRHLLLGDEPQELFLPKEINGILLHSPVGPRFSEEHQALGAMGFFVPDQACKEWAVELTLAEIIAAYAPAIDQADRVKPVLRKPDDKKTGSEE
jgi:hypothetical protein